MVYCTTKRKLGPPGGQQQVTAQPGGAPSGQHSFPAKFQARSGSGIPCEWKGCTAARAILYAHARRFIERWATGGSGHQYHRGATGVIDAFPGTQPSEAGAPNPAWRALQTSEVAGF